MQKVEGSSPFIRSPLSLTPVRVGAYADEDPDVLVTSELEERG